MVSFSKGTVLLNKILTEVAGRRDNTEAEADAEAEHAFYAEQITAFDEQLSWVRNAPVC